MGRNTLMSFAVEIVVPGTEGLAFAPAGVSSPQAECLGCTVTGGTVRRLVEPTSGQAILLVDPDAPEVSFRYRFADHPGTYPEVIFHPAASRHIRQRLSGSNEPASVLALRYGVSEETARKWKRRDSVQDLSATPHNLQTTLTAAQEAVVVQLRRLLLLPLDDLLAVTREFLNPDVSRSGLDRCLRRHGVSNLKALIPKTPAEPRKTFKAYEPGFLHVDLKYLPQMADETSRRYLFVAIDRATRWVFVRILPVKTAANARRFLRDLHRSCPIRITKILTDNGKEFTDRLFASRARAASGSHEFDQLCAELGIEHRLTPPKSPQTNGMVERFNGRIADVLKTNRFDSALDLEQTLMRYVALYNTQLPQSVLGSRTPMQAMKDWHKSHPQLFVKSPRNLPGRDR
jgi:transposase InsO family protein